MTEKVKAHCASCGKAYLVPAGDKTYRCKACGGAVEVGASAPVAAERDAAPASADEPAPTGGAGKRECAQCGAENPASARFCEQCGAWLASRTSKGRKAARAGPSSDVIDKREAALDLKRARKWLKAVRAFYVLNALYWMAATGVALDVSAPGESDTGAVAMAGLAGLMTVLCVAGALDVWRGPFVWSLLLAAMSTVSLISLVVLGTVPSIPHLLAVVGLWCAVAATAPVARILREHPDLYSAKYFRKGKGAKAIDGFDARRFGIWTAAALLIAALAGWKVRADRPPTFDDRAAEFAAVWNAADLQGVAAFFPPDKRDRLANSLERMVAYKAWDEHPTATLDRVFYETSTRVQVYFASAKGELLTHWRLRDGQWELTAVDLPDR